MPFSHFISHFAKTMLLVFQTTCTVLETSSKENHWLTSVIHKPNQLERVINTGHQGLLSSSRHRLIQPLRMREVKSSKTIYVLSSDFCQNLIKVISVHRTHTSLPAITWFLRKALPLIWRSVQDIELKNMLEWSNIHTQETFIAPGHPLISKGSIHALLA